MLDFHEFIFCERLFIQYQATSITLRLAMLWRSTKRTDYTSSATMETTQYPSDKGTEQAQTDP
jgi:hypothetical protein